MQSTNLRLNLLLQQKAVRDLNNNQKEILQLLDLQKGEELLNMIEKDANLIIDAIKPITLCLSADFCFHILKKLIEKFQAVFVWYLGDHKEDFESLITNGVDVDNVKRILEFCLRVPFAYANKTEAQKISDLAQKVQCWRHIFLLSPYDKEPPFIEIFQQINELEQIASNGLEYNEFTKKVKSIKRLIASAQQFNKLNILEQYYLENKKNIFQIENNYFRSNGISKTKQLENPYKVASRHEKGLEIKNKQLNIVYGESNNVIRGTPKWTEEIKSGNNHDFTPSRLPYNRSAADIEGLYNNQGNRRFTASGIFSDFTGETPKRTKEVEISNNRDFNPSRLPYNGFATNIEKDMLQNKFRKRFFLEERLLEDENMTIEYKKYNYPFSDDIKEILKQTICAFLNKFGGRIYIGVADNKVVCGIKLSRKKRDELKRGISQLTESFVP